MLPKSRNFVPPSQRPPNAPSKKEIDDLVADHIGGYNKREIMRLIEIHKHFVDFHYEPKSSDGGLIADDGTDPLYYYQSNLPIIRRLMEQRRLRPDDDGDEDEEDDDPDGSLGAQDLELRLQELRDGVANNAIVAVEKGRLSKAILVQRRVATNMQNNDAIMDAIQEAIERGEVFVPDPDERIEGRGTLTAQVELLQSLLKFRRDQCNQMKKLCECLAIKVQDLITSMPSASPAAGRRGGARIRAVAHAALNRSGGDKGEGGENEAASGEIAGEAVDLELLRALASENAFLRREQDYLYYRLYGYLPKPDAAPTGPSTANNSNKAGGTPGVGGAPGSKPRGANTVAGGGSTAAGNRVGLGAKTASKLSAAATVSEPGSPTQVPIENHPEFGSYMRQKEKDLRAEMEAVYTKMVEAEVARQIVSTTKGSEAFKRLNGELEDHKAMLERCHKQMFQIFESGGLALRVSRSHERTEMERHDSTQFVKQLEKVVVARSIKEHNPSDATPVGRSLQSLYAEELLPQIETITVSSVDVVIGEIMQQQSPLSEDALERICLAVGCAGDALASMCLKFCGSVFAVATMFPEPISMECGQTMWRVLRVIVPQWLEENITKFALGVGSKAEHFRCGSFFSVAKERHPDLKRLLKASRGSSRRRSSRSFVDDPDELAGAEVVEPLSDTQGPSGQDADASQPPEASRPASGISSSRRSLTPYDRPVMVSHEVQCELLKGMPNSARSDNSGSAPDTGSGSPSSRGGKRKGSSAAITTPRSGRSHSLSVAHVDISTQTDIKILRGSGCQTEDSSEAADRIGSATRRGNSPNSLQLSRPVSAMRFPNPLVETPPLVKGGKVVSTPMIPHKGAVVIASIEDVDQLWLECPAHMPTVQEAYLALLRDECTRLRGIEVRTEDDVFLCIFASEVDALVWSQSVQVHAMYLPYPPEMLVMKCASEVPHPAELGGPVAQTATSRTSASETGLETGILKKWLWRGFRVRIALHSGIITSALPPLPGAPVLSAAAAPDVLVGGPAFAFAAKMALIAKGGTVVTSQTFLTNMDMLLHEHVELTVPSGYHVIPWESVPKIEDEPLVVIAPAHVDATSPSAVSSPQQQQMPADSDGVSIEQLLVIVPDDLKLRTVTPPSAQPADTPPTSSTTHFSPMLQRWVCGFQHQLDVSQKGKRSKLAFALIDIESAEEFPHYQAETLRSASRDWLAGVAVKAVERQNGRCFALTHRSMIATFEDPISTLRVALQLQVAALQHSFPQEIFMIPHCSETYEDSALTWRGLRVRVVCHWGSAGPVLRHMQSQVLEYFGGSLQRLNEDLSVTVPFGAVFASDSMLHELSGCEDLLENPVMVSSVASPSFKFEGSLMIPRLLAKREESLKKQIATGACLDPHIPPTWRQSPYPPTEFSYAAFEAKRTLPEYASGVPPPPHGLEAQAPPSGILAMTHHSILKLLAEEVEERNVFALRLKAAVEAEQDKGKTAGGRLPTRTDCMSDILHAAELANVAAHKLITATFPGAFLAVDCSNGNMTRVYVFPHVGEAITCALQLQKVLPVQLLQEVAPSIADKFERVFSAASGQVIMEGVLSGMMVHSGCVHVAHSAGCRRWAYYGAPLAQAATVAHDVACSGEIIVSDTALAALRKYCGPSDLNGHDADEFISKVLTMSAVELIPPADSEDDVPPLQLVGDVVPCTLQSVTLADDAERLAYLLRKESAVSASSDADDQHRQNPSRLVEAPMEKRQRHRNLQSRFGFTSLHTAWKEATDGTPAAVAKEWEEALPSYIWNGALVQKVYRSVWKLAVKAGRVMGFPVEVDLDPTVTDGALLEATADAKQMVRQFLLGSNDVDPGQIMELRTLLDDQLSAVLQRIDAHVRDMWIALSARLERPSQMHRSMQSAVIIPPTEKDDSALYKTHDVGPGKRVTTPGAAPAGGTSRPMSRERSLTPTSPAGNVSLLPFHSHQAQERMNSASGRHSPLGGGGATMVSIGTENPRFLSAGRRPNSRQRGSTPPLSKCEAATQNTPADVSSLVTTLLPGALVAPAWGSTASMMTQMFRPGAGADVAAIRIKERRIMELERAVEELQEQLDALREQQNPVFSALRHAARTGESPWLVLPRTTTPGAGGTSWFQTTGVRHQMLPPLQAGEEEAIVNNTSVVSALQTSAIEAVSDSAIERGDVLAARSTTTTARYSDGTAARKDEDVDFSSTAPLMDPNGRTVMDDTTGGYDSQASATMAITMRHMPPSRQHWRRSSPLAPLQCAFQTSFQDDGGLLLTGESSSKAVLVSPFTAAASAVQQRGKTPVPVHPKALKSRTGLKRAAAAGVSDVSSRQPQRPHSVSEQLSDPQ